MIYYVVLTIILTLSVGTYLYIKNVCKKYDNYKLKKQVSGFSVAKEMLDHNNINDIYIIEKKHTNINTYDYRNKVIRLNSDTFHKENIVSCITSAFITNYAIEKDKTIVKFNDFINFIINVFSCIGIIAIFISLFGSIMLFKGGVFLLTLVIIIEIVSLVIEFKNSDTTIGALSKLKIITAKESNDALIIINAYRFKNLSGIVLSIINLITSLF